MGGRTALQHRGRHRPPRPPKSNRLTILAVILIVIGVLIMLTPVVLTRLYNAEQIETAREYSRAINDLPADQRQRELTEAHAWNTRQAFPATADPWTVAPDESSPGYQDYLRQLDAHPVMSRVVVPTAQIDLPVYHGTSEQTLAHGAGHIFGTALPVGGHGTHAVITGHTGISTATLFDNLTQVALGETFTVHTMGEVLTYRVDDISVVLPEETERIRPEEGRDLVTLITCTPYGVNSHRLLVRGERITTEPGSAPESSSNLWQRWMLLTLVVCVLIVLGLIIWLLRRKKNA